MHLQVLVAARPKVRLALQPASIASRVVLSLTNMTAHLQPKEFRCDVMRARLYPDIPGPDLWVILDSDTEHNMPASCIIHWLIANTSSLGAFAIEARMGRGYRGMTRYLFAHHNPEE